MAQKRSFGFSFNLGGNKKAKPSIFEDADTEEQPVKKKLPPSALLSDNEFQKYQQSQQHDNATTSLSSSTTTQPEERIEGSESIVKEASANEEEEDPLDAFMSDVHSSIEQGLTTQPKIRRDDIEDEDDMESFLKFRKEKKQKELHSGTATIPAATGDLANSDDEVYAAAKGSVPRDEDDIEYDMDDNPIYKPKDIGPLAPLDHSKISYDDFNKEFYEPVPEIRDMTAEQLAAYRKQLDIHVSGYNCPHPVKSFEQCGFDDILLTAINNENYTEPTVIQKQALPVALSGRDIIGIAKTGSGKTAAFVWPMLVHVMDQPELDKGEGPIAVICAPTRELAHQIYLETKKFAKGYGIKCAAVYGGLSKGDQFKVLRAGVEVVVATPGRMIDMIKMKACKMTRVTYLVLDEADKMFDMGFEPQIRSIVGQIRPDRQTLLFSATFKKKVERLAREILTDPIRINIGTIGEANQDVHQVVQVFKDYNQKLPWLFHHITEFLSAGSVLVFVSTKASAEDLALKLKGRNIHAAALHGDKDQTERDKIMFAFKNQNLPVLVATDVAARGLDIKSVKNVVNFEAARNIESHTHRIGRTGRAGEHGVAYTLLTQNESNFAAELVRNLEGANQVVAQELLDLAMQNTRFRKQRQRYSSRPARGGGLLGARSGRGRGRGIGYSEAPKDTTATTAVPAAASFTPSTASAAPSYRQQLAAQFHSAFKASTTQSMQANYVPKPQPPPPPPVTSPPAANTALHTDDRDKDRDRDRDRDRDYRDRDRDYRDRDRDRDYRDRDRDRDRNRDYRDYRDRDYRDRDRDRDYRDRDRDRDRHRDYRDSRDRRG